jgi:hypothetical protein
MAYAGLLVVVCVGVGCGWLQRLRVSSIDGLTMAVFAAAAGLGVLGMVVWAFGLCGAFRPTVLPLAFVACAMTAGVHPTRFAIPALSRWGRGIRCWWPDALTAALTLFIAVMAFLTLTGALAPPTSNEWDALAYHLAVPKVWLHDGRIHAIPYDHHSNFPMLTEMLFSIGLSLKSVSAAKLVHWLYGCLCALACYWAGRRWVSRKAGLLAAALFMACPLVAWEGTTAYIDLASTLYVSLAVFAFLCWRERAEGEGNGWLVLCGVLAGFACGTKMTMIITSGMLVLWAAGAAGLRRGVAWKHVALVTGVMAVLAAPWYIKTWILTGNPVYPFAYSIFGGRWWSEQAALDYAAEQARFGIGKTLYGFLMAPWSTTFHAQYYANPPAVYDGTLQDARSGAVFPAVFATLGLGAVGFAPLWLARPARRDENAAPLRAMLLYCVAFLVIWFALTHQTRYLLPLLPLLLIPASAAARAFWHAGQGWRAAVITLTGVCLLWGVIPSIVLAMPAMSVAWGGESQDAYLRRTEPIYSLSQSINQQLPRDAKILFLQETRGFYIDRAYQWGNPSQNALIPWNSLNAPEQMDAALRAQGITHVLVNWSAAAPATESERWPALARTAIERGRWKPVIMMGRGGYTGMAVYAIGPN